MTSLRLYWTGSALVALGFIIWAVGRFTNSDVTAAAGWLIGVGGIALWIWAILKLIFQ